MFKVAPENNSYNLGCSYTTNVNPDPTWKKSFSAWIKNVVVHPKKYEWAHDNYGSFKKR